MTAVSILRLRRFGRPPPDTPWLGWVDCCVFRNNPVRALFPFSDLGILGVRRRTPDPEAAYLCWQTHWTERQHSIGLDGNSIGADGNSIGLSGNSIGADGISIGLGGNSIGADGADAVCGPICFVCELVLDYPL